MKSKTKAHLIVKEEMKAVLIELETMPTSCRGKTQEHSRTQTRTALLFVMVKLRLSM